MARGSDPPRDRQRGDVLTGGFPDPGLPRRNGWRAGPDRDRRRRSGGAARATGPGLRAIRSMAATRVRGSARERARAVHLPRHRARTRGRYDAHRCPPRGYHPAHPAAPEGKVSATDRIVSLLICDDHKLLTDALATVVGLDEELQLIAPPVNTPEEAIRLAEEHLPDVVLMDIVFKGDGMSGIDATRRIKEASPSTNVVIMTAHDDERLLVEAVEAGASGFLSKDEAAVEILAAAKAAADGEVLIDPTTLTRLLAQVARQREEQRDALVLLDDLTDREREILGLLAQGKRNDDIARELYISPQTVQTHVRNILGKLRVHSKLEAVALAVRHGAPS